MNMNRHKLSETVIFEERELEQRSKLAVFERTISRMNT